MFLCKVNKTKKTNETKCLLLPNRNVTGKKLWEIKKCTDISLQFKPNCPKRIWRKHF